MIHDGIFWAVCLGALIPNATVPGARIVPRTAARANSGSPPTALQGGRTVPTECQAGGTMWWTPSMRLTYAFALCAGILPAASILNDSRMVTGALPSRLPKMKCHG